MSDEETTNVEETMDPEPTAPETEGEGEAEQKDTRSFWIVGGAIVAALAVVACCLLAASSSFTIGRGFGKDTPTPAPTTAVPKPPEPVIYYPAEGVVGQPAEFNGSDSRPGSSPIVNYEWHFGDGDTGRGAVVTHVYKAPAKYQVTLTVTGQDGLFQTSSPVRVTIKEGEAPAPGLPTIQSFSVTPSHIPAGECVGIAWSVSDEAALVQVRRNGKVVIDKGGPTGQQMDCLEKAGDYVYRLEAYNSAGESVFQEVAIRVIEEQVENPLANTNWTLSSMNATEVPVPGTALTVFFSADGQVEGQAGCNSYSGTYKVDGSALSIKRLTSGRVACGEAIDQQEQNYLGILQSAAAFEMSGSQLIVRDARGRETLRFNRIG